MDAIQFIRERNRMCATYTPKRCEGCPADNYGGGGVACIMADKINAEKLVPIVEKWSTAHPRKTRQSVFLEQWPDAKLDGGVLCICPVNMSAEYRNKQGICENLDCSCPECRHKFWMQELK